MTKYKSKRIVDGKPQWVIVDETDKVVNRNPSEEELKGTKQRKLKGSGYSRSGDYNETNTCDICRINFDEAAGHPLREYDNNGNWTRKWICAKCKELIKTYGTTDLVEIQIIISKSNYVKPNYWNKTNTCDKCGTKLVNTHPLREYDNNRNWTGKCLCQKCSYNSDFRDNNLDPNSDHGKGYIGEQVTCITRHLENLNIINNDFNSPIDHSIDLELSILQTKLSTYRIKKNNWSVNLINEIDGFGDLKEFDNLIYHCMDINMQNIVKDYIFPCEELIGRKSITITKDRKKGFAWYDEWEVYEKPYDDVYQNLKFEDCPVLRNDNGFTYIREFFAK